MRATADQVVSGHWHPSADSQADPHSITWNGVPFVPSAAPVRQSRVVRLRAQGAQSDPPSHADPTAKTRAILWEHDICLVSPDVTLRIISSAPEAEDELPTIIITDYRDLGTFRNATLYWRGREDHAFVSASQTEARLAITQGAARPQDGLTDLVAYTSASRNALRSGIIVGGPRFTAGMSPDDIELANHLIMYRDQDARTVYSYDELGPLYGVNGQTISRRHAALVDKFPHLKTLIDAFRAKNTKKPNLPPPLKGSVAAEEVSDDADDERED